MRISLKYFRPRSLLAGGLLLFAMAAIAQEPTLASGSRPAGANVVVSQDNAVSAEVDSGGIQARWLNSGQYRSLSQTFEWRSGDGLAAIALRISPNQNQRYKFENPQRYSLDIQELSSDRTVLTTLSSVVLQLRPALVQPEKYLVITLDKPLQLKRGYTYGFHIRPMEENVHNCIIFSVGGYDKGDAFPDGVANQLGTPGLISAGARYGNAVANFDLTFCLISSAKP